MPCNQQNLDPQCLKYSGETEIKPIGNTNNKEDLTNVTVEKLSKADT